MRKKWYRPARSDKEPRLESYILRNTTKNDINLGDLRYKIPAGKCRDLLSKTANIPFDQLIKSVQSGSISVRLGRQLIEVHSKISAPILVREIAEPGRILFPQRVKSSIVIEVGDVSEEIRELAITEDDEYLKKLEEESMGGTKLPIIADKK